MDEIQFIDLGGELAPQIAALKSGEIDLIDASDNHSREALEGSCKYVTPDMFMDEALGRMFTAMKSSQMAPNMVNVGAELCRLGTVHKYDYAKMARAAAECPCSLDYEDYAVQVMNYYNRRTPMFKQRGVEL